MTSQADLNDMISYIWILTWEADWNGIADYIEKIVDNGDSLQITCVMRTTYPTRRFYQETFDKNLEKARKKGCTLKGL